MNKLFDILILIFGVFAVILIILLVFVLFYKPFGEISTKKEFNNYLKRILNIKKYKFFNYDFSIYTNYKDIYASRTTNKGRRPESILKAKKYNYIKNNNKEDVLITWFGHSTMLLQMHDMNILIDPILDNISPIKLLSPKRFSEVPYDIDNLPDIDILVITHDHYDHLDYKVIRKLNNKTKRFIVPLGIDKDLIRFGTDYRKISSMAWWEEIDINGLKVICTPSRHFSGRVLVDSNKALWASFIFKDEYNTIFDSGDGGYGEHFKQIGEKYGKIDLALLDSAQYNEKWHDVHMFPEESLQATIDLGATIGMPVHWGAFVLSNHSWDDPPTRYIFRAKELNQEYMMPMLGQTVNLKDYKKYKDMWWKDIK